MSRFATVASLITLGGILIVIGSAPPTLAARGPKQPKPEPPTGAFALVEALNRAHPEFPMIPQDPQTKLKDLLRSMEKTFSQPGKKFFLQFEINRPAFLADGVADPAETAIVAEKDMPAVKNISVGGYLRKLLDRVPTESGATFVVRKDCIEITTGATVKKQIWGDHPGPYLPLVHARFEKTLLAEALQHLADQSDYNIVLDAKVGDRAKTTVTARLLNVPLDTAVTMLADMAELQPVQQDNAIFVTTRENALRWESRNRKPVVPGEEPVGPRIGSGPMSPILPQLKMD